MMARVPRMAVLRERFRWGGYGFIGGIVLGLILGWAFHKIVGAILWVGFVGLALVPLLLVFLVWRRLSDRGRSRDNVVVTRTVVLDRDGREEL